MRTLAGVKPLLSNQTVACRQHLTLNTYPEDAAMPRTKDPSHESTRAKTVLMRLKPQERYVAAMHRQDI
jgi:hypothetical protein